MLLVFSSNHDRIHERKIASTKSTDGLMVVLVHFFPLFCRKKKVTCDQDFPKTINGSGHDSLVELFWWSRTDIRKRCGLNDDFFSFCKSKNSIRISLDFYGAHCEPSSWVCFSPLFGLFFNALMEKNVFTVYLNGRCIDCCKTLFYLM